jgi:hypothetical protein
MIIIEVSKAIYNDVPKGVVPKAIYTDVPKAIYRYVLLWPLE